MGVHLGDFGTPRDPVEMTFGFCGETIRVHPDLSDLAVMELFGGMAAAGEDGSQAVAALGQIATVLVHPDDVERFRTTVRKTRQTVEDLANLAAGLLEAITGRPTQQPSGSSDGLPSIGQNSTDGSSSPAMQVLDGRPDLQVAVLRARRAG